MRLEDYKKVSSLIGKLNQTKKCISMLDKKIIEVTVIFDDGNSIRTFDEDDDIYKVDTGLLKTASIKVLNKQKASIIKNLKELGVTFD